MAFRIVPALQPDRSQGSKNASLALVLIANIAIEKRTLLSLRYVHFCPFPLSGSHKWTFISTLTDVSRSILMYLHDEASPNRVVAVDIGSRGFHIWQNYVNAMDLLRALFRLSIGHGGGTASPAEKEANRSLALHARSGVLHIAAGETPLFVSTITLDIMDARSVVHRNATMQLIAFIIRRASLAVSSCLVLEFDSFYLETHDSVSKSSSAC